MTKPKLSKRSCIKRSRCLQEQLIEEVAEEEVFVRHDVKSVTKKNCATTKGTTSPPCAGECPINSEYNFTEEEEAAIFHGTWRSQKTVQG